MVNILKSENQNQSNKLTIDKTIIFSIYFFKIIFLRCTNGSPDVCDEPDAEDKFKEVSEAYAVLSDDEKRQRYDQFGHAGMDGFTAEDFYQNVNFDDIFQGFDIGNIFEMFGFGGGGRSRGRTGPQRGSDIYTEVPITLEEAFEGCDKEIKITRNDAQHVEEVDR